MKKNLFISVALILIALGSYYYGAQRGVKAATDIITLQLGMKAVDQMVMNSALLLSIKKEKPEMTLQIAQQLVEHDVKHLDKIEMMLEEIPLDEFDKNIFRVGIVKARKNHKLVNDL